MVFTEAHWEELVRQGYTIVPRAIDEPCLRSAQDAANHLNAIHPDRGWERSRNELWREIRHCTDPAFLALATAVLDPLALEILETRSPASRPRAGWAGIFISMAARSRRLPRSMCCSGSR